VGNEIRDARRIVEGELRYRLYDCVWNRAVKDYGVEFERGRLQELQEHAEDLQQFAREVEQEFQARQTAKHRRSLDRGRHLDESELDLNSVLLAHSFHIDADSQAALRALSAYAELRAAEDPRVVKFRERVLGTAYLSNERATSVLQSHAARFLTLEQMRHLDVPVFGHEATLLRPYTEADREGYVDHRVTLRVTPPGTLLTLRYTDVVDGSADGDELIRCEMEGGEAIAPYKVSLPSVEVPGTGDPEVAQGTRRGVGPTLLSGFDTADRPANVWPGSLVDEVYRLANQLSESFMWPTRTTGGPLGRWWNMDAAAMFLLTGIAPLMHPINVKLASVGDGSDVPTRAVLQVQPWLTPEIVAESYKSLRQALDVNVRNQGARKFDVVSFVLRGVGTLDPDTLDFRRLRESWNATFPERRFRDTNEFSTNFKRGLEAVEQRYYM
jgi:hypothetical protein